MAKWRYVKQWENPQETIKAIDKEYGKITSSPVFFGYWARVSLYNVPSSALRTALVPSCQTLQFMLGPENIRLNE